MSRTLALAALATAWLLGLATTAWTSGEPAALVAAFGLFGAIAFWWRPGALTLVLVLAGAFIMVAAAWRYEATLPGIPEDSIARLNDGAEVRFQGVVDDDPEERGASRIYKIAVERVQEGSSWRRASGRVLLWARASTDYGYGDVLEVNTGLETPPVHEGFDYREYLLRRGIVSTGSLGDARLLGSDRGSSARAALIDIRHRLADALAEALPQPEAALAAGILFGSRSAIPNDLREDMRATGTSHLVAVSGQNVTMLAALVVAVLGWLLGRRPACWLALAGIAGYALLVGAQPSVVRAAIMGALYVTSIAVGRQNTGAVALLLAAAAMTAFEPQTIHDVSFQLSFAAVLGLILLTPVLSRYTDAALARLDLAQVPGVSVLRDVFTMTLAASAFTLPISAVTFGEVSLAAPLANLFAVPAFLAVATTSAVVTALALLLPGDNGWLSLIAWPPAAYMIASIRVFAGLPGASVSPGDLHDWYAGLWYAALGGVTWLASRQTVETPSPPPLRPASRSAALPAAGLAFVLALASLIVWVIAAAPPHGRLTLTFLDVGQGDAALIETPRGNRVLVDAGPSGAVIQEALGRHLPYYDRRLDLALVTHPQADHLGGMPTVLNRFHVGGLMTTEYATDTDLFRRWQRELDETDLVTITAHRGQWIDLGDGARLAVLNPDGATDYERLNDTSIVLRLTMGDVSFLLTGDITRSAEAALVRSGADLRAAVLKVPHHGSDSSSSPAFLNRVNPLLDVVSAGANNPYGHPAPEAIARLSGDAIFRTDEDGDVSISTDGHNVWVKTQR